MRLLLFPALVVFFNVSLVASQPQAAPAAPAGSSAAPAAAARREAYEGVVGFQGKPIGTSILLEIAPDGSVSGWIQRNDFFPVDSGHADSEHIRFTSGGNQYDINLRTERVNYSGPDGNGNQRVERMKHVQGLLYRITEPAEEGALITLRNDDGDRDYLIGEPSIWKRTGPPIDRLDFERYKTILGATTGVFLARTGGTYYVAVLEEPEGMDLQKKAPKEKKKKK